MQKKEKKMSDYKVYVHISPSGKNYIGITCQSPQKRFKHQGLGYNKCPRMWKAIKKYGWDNFKHIVLMEGLTKEEAEIVEIELIKKYKSNHKGHGYNIENGGNCSGTHSEKTKLKISKSSKGRIISEEARQKHSIALKGKMVGEKNPFYARHHKKETKIEQSRRMKGNQFFAGKHHSEEFKRAKSILMHEKYKDGKNPKCKIVQMYEAGELMKEFASLTEAALNAGISKSLLCSIIKRQEERNGKTWRYKDA